MFDRTNIPFNIFVKSPTFFKGIKKDLKTRSFYPAYQFGGGR